MLKILVDEYHPTANDHKNDIEDIVTTKIFLENINEKVSNSGSEKINNNKSNKMKNINILLQKKIKERDAYRWKKWENEFQKNDFKDSDMKKSGNVWIY